MRLWNNFDQWNEKVNETDTWSQSYDTLLLFVCFPIFTINLVSL